MASSHRYVHQRTAGFREYEITKKLTHPLSANMATARRPVHSLCQFVLVLQFDSTSKAEVADGEIAIRIYQQVRRLHVPMQDICAVDEFQTTKYLRTKRRKMRIISFENYCSIQHECSSTAYSCASIYNTNTRYLTGVN